MKNNHKVRFWHQKKVFNKNVTLKYCLILIILVFIVQCAYSQRSDSKFLDTLFVELNNSTSNYVMICAHRGNTSVYPENSMGGLQMCIEHGIDIVEMDLQETKDKHLIIMHDDTLGRSTTGFGKVKELTLSEIKRESLKMVDGTVISNEKIPTLEEYLSLAKWRVLLHVDKWMPVKDKILHTLEKEGCLKQCIFRGTYSAAKAKKIFKNYIDSIIYIPVIKGDQERVKDMLNEYQTSLNAPAIGIIFNKEDCFIVNEIFSLKKRYRIWMNAILEDNSCAGHGDKMAKKSLVNSYAWLVKKGGNIIFTDKALFMDDYLRESGRRNIHNW